MGFLEYGSQKSDTPKTPTLRQWCKQNPDSEIHCSRVKVVFNPTTYASFTFVTEHDFKVVVEKGSSFDQLLRLQLQGSLDQGACLYVQITDKDKGSWALSALEGSKVDWEEKSWGYLGGEVSSLPASKTKTARRGTTSEEASV